MATPPDSARKSRPQIDIEMATPGSSESSPTREEFGNSGFPLLSNEHDAPVKKEKPREDGLETTMRRFNSIPIFVLVGFCAIIAVALALLVVSLRKIGDSTHGPHWKGFSNVNHLFTFGDSWTDSHFMPYDEQPSTVNPMGNPEFPGGTSSNARNYVEYLATVYNQSFIGAYNLGLSGAVVNSSIIPAYIDWLDLVHESKDRFMPFYALDGTSKGENYVNTGWTSDSSLFTFFFGINDVASADKSKSPFDAVFVSYENVIGNLYDVGARNFLIMNVPPIDRAPAVTKSEDPQYVPDIREGTADWNNRAKLLAKNLRTKYKDATVFEFDTWTLFNEIMHDPQSITQTQSIKNVDSTCAVWEKLTFGATPTPEQVEQCGGLGIEEYLWINSFHITWPAHDAIAAGLKKVLTEAT